MNSKIHLAPLDSSRVLIAQRDFLCRGQNYRRGEKFTNSSVPLRTLRILYEGRAIGYPEDRPDIKIYKRQIPFVPANREAEVKNMTRAYLFAKLREIGVTIDRRWTRTRLAEELLRFENASDG